MTPSPLAPPALPVTPAAPGQENAYRALYNALQAFDAGQQLAAK